MMIACMAVSKIICSFAVLWNSLLIRLILRQIVVCAWFRPQTIADRARIRPAHLIANRRQNGRLWMDTI